MLTQFFQNLQQTDLIIFCVQVRQLVTITACLPLINLCTYMWCLLHPHPQPLPLQNARKPSLVLISRSLQSKPSPSQGTLFMEFVMK